MSDKPFKVVATNRKAGHEYFLLERLEAGIVLRGSEIKSIRAGQISLAEAYVRVDGSEAATLDRPPPPRRASISFWESVSEATIYWMTNCGK